jgi:lysophospholipase L1-like esterase
VLIVIGGNDVIYGTREDPLRASLELAIRKARDVARLVIVLSSANVSGAPLFAWPLNVILARRAMRVRAIFATTCRRLRVQLVNFTVTPQRNQFVQRPDLYFAEDGLHPTAEAYGYCYATLLRCTRLVGTLADGLSVRHRSAAAT